MMIILYDQIEGNKQELVPRVTHPRRDVYNTRNVDDITHITEILIVFINGFILVMETNRMKLAEKMTQ